MEADSSADEKKCLTVILGASLMSLNKLNVTGSSSRQYYDVWCWPNVGLMLAKRLMFRPNINPTLV